MPSVEEMLRLRPDHSQYLVHLTREGVISEKRLSPRAILEKVLRDRALRAARPHGVLHRRLAQDPDLARRTACVCLSEVPIAAVRLLCQEIDGRSVKLAPYGLIFHKDFIRKQGGNPIWYLNTYGGPGLRDAFLASIPKDDEALRKSSLLSLLPFIDVCGPTKAGGRYDFSWEREWRILGDLKFEYRDIVMGICSQPDEVDSLESLTHNEVPFIWKDASADDIIGRIRELASYRFDIDENGQKLIDEYHKGLAEDAAYQQWKDDRLELNE